MVEYRLLIIDDTVEPKEVNLLKVLVNISGVIKA